MKEEFQAASEAGVHALELLNWIVVVVVYTDADELSITLGNACFPLDELVC
jgi:hypothetical protein